MNCANDDADSSAVFRNCGVSLVELSEIVYKQTYVLDILVNISSDNLLVTAYAVRWRFRAVHITVNAKLYLWYRFR